MQNSNLVILIGYIGQHLSAYTTRSGRRRLSLRVATNTMQKQKDGSRIAVTTWHDVIAWNKRAEYAESCLVKGSRVLIRGAIEYKTFEDHTGHRRYITEILAQEITNLDR